MTFDPKKIDPTTGLPVYSTRQKLLSDKFAARAKEARTLADRLEAMLDEATREFADSFSQADELAEARKRIADAATTHRNTSH